MNPRIPAGLVNLRDVATASSDLRPGLLLRSDAPLSGDAEQQYPVSWPPSTVVDLRDLGESQEVGHPLTAVARIVQVPIMGGATYQPLTPETTLSDVYTSWLSGGWGGRLVQAVEAVLAALSEGRSPVLVHCTAGKDRTGVTVAVVLNLVGIEHEAIVDDYLRTGDAMHAVMARVKASLSARSPIVTAAATAAAASVPKESALFGVDRKAVQSVLEMLDAYPGGAVRWFTDHGGLPSSPQRLNELLRIP